MSVQKAIIWRTIDAIRLREHDIDQLLAWSIEWEIERDGDRKPARGTTIRHMESYSLRVDRPDVAFERGGRGRAAALRFAPEVSET